MQSPATCVLGCVSFLCQPVTQALNENDCCPSEQVQFGSVGKKTKKKHEDEKASAVDVLEVLHPTSGWIYISHVQVTLTHLFIVLLISFLGIVW